jgi:hypothetical protein
MMAGQGRCHKRGGGRLIESNFRVCVDLNLERLVVS